MIAKNGVDNSSLADFIELPNGCVCCTVKDNLVITLETLLEKRSDLDYILIEASGMANPGTFCFLHEICESERYLMYSHSFLFRPYCFGILAG